LRPDLGTLNCGIVEFSPHIDRGLISSLSAFIPLPDEAIFLWRSHEAFNCTSLPVVEKVSSSFWTRKPQHSGSFQYRSNKNFIQFIKSETDISQLQESDDGTANIIIKRKSIDEFKRQY
jgi:hypothetical protein